MIKLNCLLQVKISDEDQKKLNELAKKYQTTISKIIRYALRFLYEESKKSEISKKIFDMINSNL